MSWWARSASARAYMRSAIATSQSTEMDATAQLELLTILERFPHVTESQVNAWVHRVFLLREGKAPSAPAAHRYRAFVQDTMPKLAHDFPHLRPRERMKMIGQIWKKVLPHP